MSEFPYFSAPNEGAHLQGYLDVPLNLVVGRSVKVDLKELQFRFLGQSWKIKIDYLV